MYLKYLENQIVEIKIQNPRNKKQKNNLKSQINDNDSKGFFSHC
jgi:hypothetical protein